MTFVSEFTVNVVAAMPPKVTFVVCLRPDPVITTEVPGAPLVGLKPLITGVTRNVPALVAIPPGVVIPILPVFAPFGTVAITFVAKLIVNVVAVMPPNVTLLVCVSPVPVIMTEVPILPLVGVKLAIVGMTRNTLLLTSGPDGVAKVAFAVVPVAGTTAVIYVSETTVKVAAPEPNLTLVVPVRPCPRISTVWPALPDNVMSETNACRPALRR